MSERTSACSHPSPPFLSSDSPSLSLVFLSTSTLPLSRRDRHEHILGYSVLAMGPWVSNSARDRRVTTCARHSPRQSQLATRGTLCHRPGKWMSRLHGCRHLTYAASRRPACVHHQVRSGTCRMPWRRVRHSRCRRWEILEGQPSVNTRTEAARRANCFFISEQAALHDTEQTN